MSGHERHNEDPILLRMIEIEEQKIRSNEPGQPLAPEKIALVKARLLSEKDEILADFDRQSPGLSLKKSNVMKIWAPIGIAALVLAGVLLPFLFRTSTGSEGTIALLSGNVKVNGKPAQFGMKVSTGSTIEVGEKSLARVAWGDSVSLAISQKTQIKVRQVNHAQGKPDIVLENFNGVLFCEVAKNQAKVQIQTPSATAQVTGTSFSVGVSAEGTTVQVLEGTVETSATPEFLQSVGDMAQRERLSKSVEIRTKQKMLLSKTKISIVLSDMTAGEEQYLLSLRKLALMKKLSSAQTEDAKNIGAVAAEIFEKEDGLKQGESKAPPGVQKMTLAEIKNKYGKISKVNLKNGATYTGFFKLMGPQMEIITTTGTIRVPTSQLSDVQDAN